MAEASRRSDSSVRRIHTVLLTLPLVLAPACSQAPGAGEGSGETQRPNTASAEIPIDIVDLDGVEAALPGYRGKGMLLNFWAMWCGPCVAELPELGEVAAEWRERGGNVVGISYDLMVPGADETTIIEETRAFLEKRDLAFPILIFDEIDYNAINQRFGIGAAIPVTLAINSEGRIVDRQEGRADKARFEEMMALALGL